jgi:hypothetical protein
MGDDRIFVENEGRPENAIGVVYRFVPLIHSLLDGRFESHKLIPETFCFRFQFFAPQSVFTGSIRILVEALKHVYDQEVLGLQAEDSLL